LEAAKKEGQLLWYTTLIVDQIVRPLIRAFQARVPGVEVKFLRLDSTAQTVRLMNEARANRVQADVWGLIDGAGALTQSGAAAEFDLPSMKDLPASLIDPKKRWIATNLATRSLAHNTQLIPKEQAPRTYADLLDPRWKGKFAWHPTAVAGGIGFIATVLRYMGEDDGKAYLRKLARQEIVPLPIATRAVLDRVIAGEYPMGLEMVSSHAAISLSMGAPVRWVPLEAVSTTMQVAGITKGARNPNAGKLFLDFVTSRAGQEVLREANYEPMHPAIPPKGQEHLQGSYKTIVYSPEEVDANTPHWQKVYEDLFR
jgi:iron(III) transport system substrate-binding protein